MVEHFGGYQQYMDMEYWTARRHEYVWQGKNRAIETQKKRDAEALETK